MDLKTFLAPMDTEQREQFAARCITRRADGRLLPTTKGHLQNVMYGVRPCATDLAVEIERESDGVVRRWDLRPDDWHRHWPELVGAEGAPPVPVEPEAEAA